MPLKLDNDGNIVTKPVTGFRTRLIAEMAILLSVDYQEKPNGPELSIPLLLTPEAALDIAQALNSAANKIFMSPGTTPQ